MMDRGMALGLVEEQVQAQEQDQGKVQAQDTSLEMGMGWLGTLMVGS